MRHTKERLAARSKKTLAPAKKRKEINLAELREEITEMVKRRSVSLVDTMIGEADKGNLAAMKYLLEMIRLFPAPADEEEPAGENVLAKTLIRRLGLAEKIPQDSNGSSGAAGQVNALPEQAANNPNAQPNTVE